MEEPLEKGKGLRLEVIFEMGALGFLCLALVGVFLSSPYSWGFLGAAVICLVYGLMVSFFKTHRSKFSLGELSLSLMFLWIILDVCLSVWDNIAGVGTDWLVRISTASITASWFGVPLLVIGSIIAFTAGKESIGFQDNDSSATADSILIIFSVLFALCFLAILGIFFFGLMELSHGG